MTSFKGLPTQEDDKLYESVNEDALLAHSENGDCTKEETLKNDLARLEDEIHTLKSVLLTKERQAQELKRLLGITPIMDFRNDLSHGLQAVKESYTVQKTNEKMHQLGESIASTEAYQKTNAAFKSLGAFASRKIGDIRHSDTFKSMEDRVGGAYNSVKQSKSLHNFPSAQDQFTGSHSAGVSQVSTPQ